MLRAESAAPPSTPPVPGACPLRAESDMRWRNRSSERGTSKSGDTTRQRMSLWVQRVAIAEPRQGVLSSGLLPPRAGLALGRSTCPPLTFFASFDARPIRMASPPRADSSSRLDSCNGQLTLAYSTTHTTASSSTDRRRTPRCAIWPSPSPLAERSPPRGLGHRQQSGTCCPCIRPCPRSSLHTRDAHASPALLFIDRKICAGTT